MEYYTLIPKGSHKIDPKLRYIVPNSFCVEVEDFVREFYATCQYTDPIGDRSALRFYAKTSFLEDCGDKTGSGLLMALLCERNLLFERDFDILADRKWEVYRLNHVFASEWDDADSGIMIAALEETINDLNLSDNLERTLKHAVSSVKAKKLNVTRARGYAISSAAEFINDAKDMDRFQHVIWPRFVLNWSYRLWRREIMTEYKREINEDHWIALSETKKRLRSLETVWKEARDAWKTLRKDGQEVQFDVSQPQCIEFLKKYGVDENEITKCTQKMYRNAQNMRGTVSALLKAIEQCLKIPKHDLWMRFVWFVRIRDFFASKYLCGTEIDQLCQEVYEMEYGSALAFFRELNHEDLGKIPELQEAVRGMELPKEQRWKWLSILQLGMLIAKYLEDCFLCGKDYLAITDVYLLQSSVIEHYKAGYAEQYKNLVTQVGKGEKQLRAYQDIWDDPRHTFEDRIDFLKRRLRYVEKLIPAGDPDIWSDYTPVRSNQGKKRIAIIQRRVLQLKLLLFENALQDCICNRAQMQLWGLLVAQFRQQL